MPESVRVGYVKQRRCMGMLCFWWPRFAGRLVCWDKYEIKKRDSNAPVVVSSPIRPVGVVLVSELKNGTIWRLDADSVRGPKDARQAWQISDYSKNKNVTNREVKTLYRINCNTTAYRILSVVEYDKNGNVTGNWDEESFKKIDDYPPPGSILESFVNVACGAGFDPGAKAIVAP